MPKNFSLSNVPDPANTPNSIDEINRLQKLLDEASLLDEEIKILEREGRRLRIDAQEFIDKKNMVRILRHITNQ